MMCKKKGPKNKVNLLINQSNSRLRYIVVGDFQTFPAQTQSFDWITLSLQINVLKKKLKGLKYHKTNRTYVILCSVSALTDRADRG